MPQAEKIERCLCTHDDVALSERARAVASAIVSALGCFGECAGPVVSSSVYVQGSDDAHRRMRVNLCRRHQEQVDRKEVR